MTSTSSQPPVSALRARMIEDMIVRGFGERHATTRSATCGHFLRPLSAARPDTATAEGLHRFQLHQTTSRMQPPGINSAVSALRFFFTVTLDRPDQARRAHVLPQPRRLPAVLGADEVVLLLQAARGAKYKAALATAYGAGLRVSEVVALKIGDIDSERMLLRVERGKGRKDRYAMLSPQLLELLRAWWREGRQRGILLPRGWLFPGRNPIEPLSARSAQPRWEFVFQPKYAAYLNLIEPWWKILRSLALKGRRFEAWPEIEEAVRYATAYWNAHKHPFIWGRRRRHRTSRRPRVAVVPNIAIT